MTAVLGFAGLSLRSKGIALDRQLLRILGAASASTFSWRGRHLRIKIVQGEQLVEATLEAGEPMTLLVSGQLHDLRRDRTLRVPCTLRAPSKGYTDAERRRNRRRSASGSRNENSNSLVNRAGFVGGSNS